MLHSPDGIMWPYSLGNWGIWNTHTPFDILSWRTWVPAKAVERTFFCGKVGYAHCLFQVKKWSVIYKGWWLVVMASRNSVRLTDHRYITEIRLKPNITCCKTWMNEVHSKTPLYSIEKTIMSSKRLFPFFKNQTIIYFLFTKTITILTSNVNKILNQYMYITKII